MLIGVMLRTVYILYYTTYISILCYTHAPCWLHETEFILHSFYMQYKCLSVVGVSTLHSVMYIHVYRGRGVHSDQALDFC